MEYKTRIDSSGKDRADRRDCGHGASRAAPTAINRAQPQLAFCVASRSCRVGTPSTRLIYGKREIDVYRNGLMFERDHVVGVRAK